jgi:hypothetical protein
MTNFKDREKGFESKFALDEEQRFRAEVRRNKLLGAWAAGLLGKVDADADAYVQDVVAADFEEAGDEDVVRKLSGDFKAAGVPMSDDDIRAKLMEFMAQAATQVQNS